jgi:hypothetical protein
MAENNGATLAAARDQAKRLGCKLTKAKSGTRDGSVPVRYLLRDEYGVLFFRDLAQVELWLRGRQRRLAANRAGKSAEDGKALPRATEESECQHAPLSR